MSDLYFVYLDNTNQPQTVPKLFKWIGLQNFYIVKAKDVVHAKSIVLNLFKHLPNGAKEDISRCLSCTTMNTLTSHLKSPNIGLWSYVPHGNYKQPGQQVKYPSTESLLKPDSDGTAAARNYIPPKPIVPLGQDETMVKVDSVTPEDAAILKSAVPQVPVQGMPFTQEQMMAMMAMMQTMMNGGIKQAPVTQENSVPINQIQDLELQKRIQSNMASREVVEDDMVPIGGDIDLSKITG